ncbi:MAG: hypothetical protein GWN81_10905, partial [Phycisphaerae bacterium]|nr:hypothetical protein [Phycisphaerae bacterium]NIU09332.1 hypothetical protein [Phycisphaerae bacterium]NIW99090.1 hypothetical protein [Phycisphaerae bacterium]NIX28816.1 hypothetical protein [Phycisphaerae bacterium]
MISLVFVVISINRNTAELRADNVNDFYDAIREIDIGVAANSEFADVVMRGQTGEYDELSPVEAYQYDYYVLLHLNIWEQAWDRHNDGTVSTEQYEFWKTYYYVF